MNIYFATIFNFFSLIACAVRVERNTWKGRWYRPLQPRNIVALARLAGSKGWGYWVYKRAEGDWEPVTAPRGSEEYGYEGFPLDIWGASCLLPANSYAYKWAWVGGTPVPLKWVMPHFEGNRWVVCEDDPSIVRRLTLRWW